MPIPVLGLGHAAPSQAHRAFLRWPAARRLGLPGPLPALPGPLRMGLRRIWVRPALPGPLRMGLHRKGVACTGRAWPAHEGMACTRRNGMHTKEWHASCAYCIGRHEDDVLSTTEGITMGAQRQESATWPRVQGLRDGMGGSYRAVGQGRVQARLASPTGPTSPMHPTPHARLHRLGRAALHPERPGGSAAPSGRARAGGRDRSRARGRDRGRGRGKGRNKGRGDGRARGTGLAVVQLHHTAALLGAVGHGIQLQGHGIGHGIQLQEGASGMASSCKKGRGIALV